MAPPNPPPAVLPGACVMPSYSLSVSVRWQMLRGAALPSRRMPPPEVARPSVMVSPAMLTLALPLMSKIRLGVATADGRAGSPQGR